jgi:hypothetical protein
MEYFAALNNPGFVIFKSVLTPEQINKGRSNINDQSVTYKGMTDFIETDMFGAVNEKMASLEWDMQYAKYRASNNNNSVDASMFHRDVVCLDEWSPSMTCLTYLDPTVMELIPNSHRSKNKMFDMFDAVRLNVEPGDILLFYSTLLHRGIFTQKLPNRRLIQVFDCFATKELAEQHLANFTHIPGTNNLSGLMIWGSKQTIIAPVINLFGYYTFINCPEYVDVQEFVKRCMGGRSIFSSEGRCLRLTPDEDNSPQPSNKYILNEQFEVFDLDAADYDEWYWLFYKKNSIKLSIYLLFILIIFVAITYGMISAVKNIRKSNIDSYR